MELSLRNIPCTRQIEENKMQKIEFTLMNLFLVNWQHNRKQ